MDLRRIPDDVPLHRCPHSRRLAVVSKPSVCESHRFGWLGCVACRLASGSVRTYSMHFLRTLWMAWSKTAVETRRWMSQLWKSPALVIADFGETLLSSVQIAP